MIPTVWLVIPCYNEEQVLPITIPIITRKMNEIKEKHLVSDYRIVFVDDRSRDSTWEIISNFCCKDNCYLGIKLSRNNGHQNALIAGMMYAKDNCDCVITLDADLQDDIDVIEDFVVAYNEGNQIVYGVRSNRSTDTVFKRNTAQTYYKLLKAIGVETVYNHADYRLVSQQALNELDKYKETNLYLLVSSRNWVSRAQLFLIQETNVWLEKQNIRLLRCLGLHLMGLLPSAFGLSDLLHGWVLSVPC